MPSHMRLHSLSLDGTVELKLFVDAAIQTGHGHPLAGFAGKTMTMSASKDHRRFMLMVVKTTPTHTRHVYICLFYIIGKGISNTEHTSCNIKYVTCNRLYTM